MVRSLYLLITNFIHIRAPLRLLPAYILSIRVKKGSAPVIFPTNAAAEYPVRGGPPG